MRDEGQLADEEFSKLKTKIPGSGYEASANRVENGGAPADNGAEKKFLTLAEAQRLKAELKKEYGSEENDQANEDV